MRWNLVIASSNVTVAPGAKVILFGSTKSNIQVGDDGFGDGVGIINTVEGTATAAVDDTNKGSLVRCPSGSDADNAVDDRIWVINETPGEANACP